MALAPEDVDFGTHNDQKIIYVTEQQATEWSKQATQELIKLYNEKMELLEKGTVKTKKSIYEQISSELTQQNFFYTPSQCENKWKSLKRGYLTRMEKNPSLIYTRPRLFEKEVANIIRKERQSNNFRRIPELPDHTQDLFQDLNQPPGFGNTDTASDVGSDDDVKNVLLGALGSQTIEYFTEDPDEHSYSTYHFKRKRSESENLKQEAEELNSANNSYAALLSQSISKELCDMNKIIKKHCTESCTMQGNIVRCLDGLEKSAEENIQIKRIEIEKQTEIIQQMKIQNSLIAKLIQKLA